EPGSNSPNWYLERAIAHFETSDENLHSHFWISPKRSPDTHSLFSFQRSSSLLVSMLSSPATLIIYHIQPINASSFLTSCSSQALMFRGQK
ncbi:hypothetical protein, partial [Paenibacillus silagei]|uniref:hypothetical protein n=1 Tax=Paenibacillus silagei TaxID=1670801 RepID=UPI001AE7969D